MNERRSEITENVCFLMAVTGLDPWNFLHIGAPLSTRTALSQAMCQGARLLQFPMRLTPGMVRTTLESSVSYSKAQTNIFDRYSSSPLSCLAHQTQRTANCTTLEHCGTKGSALTRDGAAPAGSARAWHAAAVPSKIRTSALPVAPPLLTSSYFFSAERPAA